MRALLLVFAFAGISHADPVKLPDTKAQLDVPASWTLLPPHRDLVAAYKSPTGHVLAVTRAKVPNVSAWIKDSREAYAVEIDGTIAPERMAGLPRRDGLDAIHSPHPNAARRGPRAGNRATAECLSLPLPAAAFPMGRQGIAP